MKMKKGGTPPMHSGSKPGSKRKPSKNEGYSKKTVKKTTMKGMGGKAKKGQKKMSYGPY